MDQRPTTNVPPDRRKHPRFPVEVRGRLFQPVLGSELPCIITELSLDGCRLRTDRDYYGGLETRVELCFTMRSVAFRLCGVTQWAKAKTEVGIRFVCLNARRETELAEMLAGIAAELEASAEKDAADQVAAKLSASAARAEVDRLELELAATTQLEDEARRAAEAAAQHKVQAARQLEQAKAAQAAAEKICTHLAAREAARREALAAASAAAAEPAPDPPTPIAQAVARAAPSPPAARPATPAAPHNSRRDRRQESRHAVDCHAVILLLDVRSQITARILDISPSGCRMRCDEKFPVGIYRRVEVEFVLDGLPFRLPGVVQSLHDRFTTGIRFLDVSERRKEQLMQVIDEITEIKREAAAAQALSASGKPADMLPNA